MNESMSLPQTTPQPKQKQQAPEREQPRPIRVERLLITHTNPHGVKIPDGPEGKSDRMVHTITAGDHGDIRTAIEFRPWLRAFRVTRSKRISRTGPKGELVTFEAMGGPFFVPEDWAVWVPAEEQ